MAKKTDTELVEELFKTYGQMMLKIALGILNNRADAEDAVQDAFLRVMNNLDVISQIPQDEKAFYFVSIIENISLNTLKKKNRHPSDDIDEYYEIASDYSVEKKADEQILLNEVRSALTELSDRDYGIMYLLFFKQMTPKEIAAALDIPEKNIHKYIERAKKRLIKILNDRGINYDL